MFKTVLNCKDYAATPLVDKWRYRHPAFIQTRDTDTNSSRHREKLHRHHIATYTCDGGCGEHSLLTPCHNIRLADVTVTWQNRVFILTEQFSCIDLLGTWSAGQ